MVDISATPGCQSGEDVNLAQKSGDVAEHEDPSLLEGSQSGEDVNLAQKSGDVAEHEDPSLLEKADGYSLDKEAARIANEDLNRKKKQTYKGRMLIWLALQSTGVIYSDIGTSTLRPYRPTRPKNLERYNTGDMKVANKGIRTMIENSRVARVFLKILGVLGVAMVMSDGVLTPAQSILGAIQGLRVAQPNISSATIVRVSCAIIVVLFAVQPFGTSKIATSFAPIVMFNHSVLKAFSPFFAGSFLVRNGTDGWQTLSGLLLAFTGVEALFADLGAFTKRAIQLSWLCLAFPCLLLAYIGQAAYIAQDATETAFTNPFFYTVIPGTFYFSLVIAVMATIVASQAMITGAF
ncbi:hypothetical protein V502_02266 [Pseudogymnoascus sp. VKM F-4520 (FW-2644)]|nr:hypothetical protein V502_02266 [Pseudogymnoascus sp. VKM F-4520 (FW-2644)]